MSLIKVSSVNFGSRKGGLSTVAYRLFNADGTVNRARTTTGVFEVITDVGQYSCDIEYDDNWRGIIVWDTGDASTLYAIQDYDYRSYSEGGAGGSYGGVIVEGVWSEDEKKEVFDRLKRIIKLLKKPNKEKEIQESIQEVKTIYRESLKELRGTITKVLEKEITIPDNKADLTEIKKGLDIVSNAIIALMEAKEVNDIIKEVEGHVETEGSRIENNDF